MTGGRKLVALSVLVGLALTPASAGAQGGVDLRVNEATKWPERQLVLSLPSKRLLSAGQVNVTENGHPVLSPRLVSEAANRKRGVVLAIDASLTMRGEPIRQAMVAARSFARRRAANTAIGVIYFSRDPKVALQPTTDTAKIRSTLAVTPGVTRGTKIYDAAATGIEALRSAGLTSGAIIVLSDGAEAQRGSSTSPTALTALSRASNIRIFSVGLGSLAFDPTFLQKMSSSTGGHYGEAARPKDLPPLFAALGERLSSEYVVNYRSTAEAGAAVDVNAYVDGFSGPSTLTYKAPELAFGTLQPDFSSNASDGLSSSRVLLLAIAFFVVIGFVMYLVVRPKQRSVVSRVTDFAGPAHLEVRSMESVRRRQHDASPRWQRYAEAIELSGISVSPAALALWTATGTLVFAWYLGFMAGRPALVVLAAVVPFGVRAFVMMRLKTRRRQFEEQLPDNLQVLASALRAGYSFSAGIATMAEDAAEPSRTELRRASTDEQLGVDISESLAAIGRRMKSPEIEYVGIVARMQRESGGNTAEVLEQVMETIRARHQLKRMVRTLTAQGRFGGIIISLSPIIVAVGMAITNPGYFDPMFDSSLGVALLLIGIVLLTCGWLIIRKIVDVEA